MCGELIMLAVKGHLTCIYNRISKGILKKFAHTYRFDRDHETFVTNLQTVARFRFEECHLI